ncbi:transcription factor HES-5-like [Polymixia lowei]
MAPVTQSRPDERQTSVENSSNKLRKLMVEKVRRDRINHSIEQLRTLLNRGEEIDGQTSSSKLDKADILEKAVSFMTQRAIACIAPSYFQGFSQCLQETLRHLSLHAPLQPAEREEIKRFYVLQRTALQRQMSGDHRRRTVSMKRSGSRSSSARSQGSLWRPW